MEQFFALLLLFSIIQCLTAASHNVTLQNCSAESLNKLPNLHVIKELSLDFCDAKNPAAGNFKGFSTLTMLQISDSTLQNWHNTTLNDLQYLVVLSLPGNNISQLENWANKPLTSLNRLELQRNALQIISPQDFEFYPNLQTVDLSQNRLETIESNGFSKLNNLKYLNLSYNALKYINGSNFLALQHLTQLELDNNEIENITENTFETNSHLHTLNLSNNKLKSLAFLKVKSLSRLFNVNLSKNAIEDLQLNGFEMNFELINLDLSWNSLKNLTEIHFEGLKTLEVLNISHNGLLNITANVLQPLCSLRELVLSSNNLSSLPTALFNFTPLLEHIDLSNNGLNTITSALFSKLPYLTKLQLGGNKLLDIAFIAELPHAQLALDLSDNLLRSSMLDMKQLIKFRKIQLAGNPLNCQWLIEEIGKRHSNIYFGQIYNIPKRSWTSELLNLTGISCYDEVHGKNVIILSMGCNNALNHDETTESKKAVCHESTTPQIQIPPPAVWPKLKADKFDSRSVIIWMLIAIAIAFAALRLAQQFLENKNSKTYLRMLRPQRSDGTEMEILHTPEDERTNTTPSPHGKLKNSYRPNATTV